MALTRKLIIPVLVIFTTLLAGVFIYFFIGFHGTYHETEEADLISFNSAFSAEMENQQFLALALASQAAANPAVQEALANKDRGTLLEVSMPGFKSLIDSNLSLIQFHSADGSLLLEIDELGVVNAENSITNPMAILANSEQTPTTGMGTHSGTLNILGVVPVYYQGSHIGSVSYGIGFNESLLMTLKEKYGGEWQILLSREFFPEYVTPTNIEAVSPNSDLLLFATTQSSSLFNDKEGYSNALRGEVTITHPSVNGRDYAILSAPMYDYSGRVVAVLDIVYDHTHISTNLNTRLLFAGLFSSVALILGSLILVAQTRRTLQPIKTLITAFTEVTQGNFTPNINLPAGNDELGILVNAFNRMNTQLRHSITDLEQRVADRTRDLENQTLRLRMAADIARDAASARDLNSMLDRAAELIHQRFGFYHTGIYIVDVNREFALLTASPTEAGKAMIANKFKLQVGEPGIVGRVAATGEARLNADIGRDAIRAIYPLLPKTRSEMALPLKVENKVIGVLEIQSDQRETFNQDDLTIMQVMADQLAIAIERTRLIQEVERNLFELERAYGQYTREGWQRLSASGRVTNKGYRFNNVRIEPIGENGIGSPIEPFRVNGNNEKGELSHNLVTLPIKLRGQTVGIVHAKLKEGYGENTISTLELAIDRLASALESARLYEEASIRADREQAISQITAAISSSTEYESILQTTVREIGNVLSDVEVTVQIIDDTDN